MNLLCCWVSLTQGKGREQHPVPQCCRHCARLWGHSDGWKQLYFHPALVGFPSYRVSQKQQAFEGIFSYVLVL